MKKVFDFLKRKHIVKKHIKHHVSNGLFFIDNGLVVKLSLSTFFKNILKLYKYYFIFSKKKQFVYKTGQLIFGSQKLTFIVNDRAFNFYLSKESFENGVEKYNKYFIYLKYPLAKVINIDYDTHSFETELIVKNRNYSANDFKNISLLLLDESFLPDFHGYFEANNDVVLTYLQHGDCHYNNFVLINRGFGFSVIDIDDVKIYPAFFDYFYFCSFAKDVDFASLVEMPNVSCLMNKILLHYGFKMKDNVVDYYLSIFVQYFINNFAKLNSINISTIMSWSKRMDLSFFPLTNKSVETLDLMISSGGYER